MSVVSHLLSRLPVSKRTIALLPLLASAACNLDNTTSTGPVTGFVQFINAAPRYATADFYIDSVSVLSSEPYGIDTLYVYSPAALTPQTFTARVANTATVIATTQGVVLANTLYTVVLTQHTTGGGMLFLPDTVSAPAGGDAAVRVVNVAPSAGPVDVYVTSRTTDISTVTPPDSMTNIPFEGMSPYLRFLPDTVRVRVTAAGTKTVLLDVDPVPLVTSGQVWTILMLDAPAGGPPYQADVLGDRSF